MHTGAHPARARARLQTLLTTFLSPTPLYLDEQPLDILSRISTSLPADNSQLHPAVEGWADGLGTLQKLRCCSGDGSSAKHSVSHTLGAVRQTCVGDIFEIFFHWSKRDSHHFFYVGNKRRGTKQWPKSDKFSTGVPSSGIFSILAALYCQGADIAFHHGSSLTSDQDMSSPARRCGCSKPSIFE